MPPWGVSQQFTYVQYARAYDGAMDRMLLDEITIMRNITTVRQRFDACTLRKLAAEMGINESTLRIKMLSMTDRGIVSYNAVPGSLKVTDLGQRMVNAELNQARYDELVSGGMDPDEAAVTVWPELAEAESPDPADLEPSEPEPEPEPTPVVKKAPAKKRAVKKRAAKKAAARPRSDG